MAGAGDTGEGLSPEELEELLLTEPELADAVPLPPGYQYHFSGETEEQQKAAAAGASALNQWMERDLDSLMHRTRSRPLPSGRLSAGEGLAFGATLAVSGVALLAVLPGLQKLLRAALKKAGPASCRCCSWRRRRWCAPPSG